MNLKTNDWEYDCTGQKFTAGVDFYKVHNGTWIYHRIGVDV